MKFRGCRCTQLHCVVFRSCCELIAVTNCLCILIATNLKETIYTNVLRIRNWRMLLHMHGQTLCVHPPGGSTFSLKWMTSWPHLKSVKSNRKSDSINRWVDYLLEEQSCQISSRSDLKRRSIRFLTRVVSTRTRRKEQQDESDMRSVPDLKTNERQLTQNAIHYLGQL